MVSDGELEEGQVWEAALFAAYYRLGRLVVLVDANNSQVDGPVDTITTLEPIAAKWSAFGWHVQDLDGHDPDALSVALAGAAAHEGQPSVLVCRTSTVHGLDCLPPDADGHFIKLPPNSPRPRSGNSPASWRPSVREPPISHRGQALRPGAGRPARGRDEVLCLSGDLTRECEVDLFQEELPAVVHPRGHGRGEHDEHGRCPRPVRRHPVRRRTPSACSPPGALRPNRYAIAYPGLPVRIIGFMPGVFDARRPSHQAIDDVALMRTLPNMTVVDVADAVEVRQVAAAVVDVPGPVYVRLKRGETPVIFGEDHVLRLGRAEVLVPGGDVALFGQRHDARRRPGRGAGARRARRLRLGHQRGDHQAAGCGHVQAAAAGARIVVTAENHTIIGGLGSAVAETIAEAGLRPPLHRVGLRDTFAEGSLTAPYLFAKYGLSTQALIGTDPDGARAWRAPRHAGRCRRERRVLAGLTAVTQQPRRGARMNTTVRNLGWLGHRPDGRGHGGPA